MNDYIVYDIHQNICLPINSISTIKYGLDNDTIDITQIAFKKCLLGNIIKIPSNDHNRAAIFGDPLKFIEKKIYIKLHNNTILSDIKNINLLLPNYNIDQNIENIVNDYQQTRELSLLLDRHLLLGWYI
jgi:hypothetical protein